jgi:hypothetical protein
MEKTAITNIQFRIFRTTVPIGVFLSVLLSASSGWSQRLCDDISARLVARAYVVSFPYIGTKSKLQSHINANKSAFSATGSATQCMKSLSAGLRKQGTMELKVIDPRQFEKVSCHSSVEQCEQAKRMDATRVRRSEDKVVMADELDWLAQVLPAAVAGNFAPFDAQNTPRRQMMLKMLQEWRRQKEEYERLCRQAGGCGIAEPKNMEAEFRKIMDALLPQIEQQIVGVAIGTITLADFGI